MKNVVFISETMPLGGTSTFAVNVCEGLSRTSGWRGIAATMRKLAAIGEQMRSSQLPLILPSPGAILHEERIEHLYRECARFSPHAVVAALSAGSFEFLRFVPHGCIRVGMIQSDESQVYDLVERFFPHLDAVAGVSKEICRRIEARVGDKKVPVFHQPYGVPMPSAPAIRPSAGPLRVLYLGRVVEEQKRVHLMARIIKTTLLSGADLNWTIAGDGADLPYLREELQACSDRITFLGAVPYQKVPKVLASHDVYFLCSDYEGLPLSLLEAMGEGLVPVVSDLPSGISEVVSATNGIRVPVHDESGYAQAIIGLAEDRSRLASLSSSAISAVRESHSTLAMAHRWEAMLDGLLPATPPVWAAKCRATAPLEVMNQWQYSKYLRPLRAAFKRYRLRQHP